MRRVQACPCRQVAQQSGNDSCNFLKPRADRRSHSRGVFNQNLQSAHRHALRGLLHGLDYGRNRLNCAPLAPRAWMHHQKIRSQRHGSHDLIVESLDRPSSQHRLPGGQIDQIIRVNHQWPQPQVLPSRTKCGGIQFRDPRWSALPHSGAGGKNLQRVAA